MKNYLLLAVYSTTFFNSLFSIENETDFSLSAPNSEIIFPSSTPSLAPHYPLPKEPINPNLAAFLSMLYPGLGHAYIGDVQTAGCLVGGSTLALGTTTCGKLLQDEALFSSGSVVYGNTWLYGIYAAYRDVRIANGSSGFSYKMPTDSFADLVSAPFNPSILKKPEVWGGTIGALLCAFSVGYLAYSNISIQPHALSASGGSNLKPILALPVGIGEEAFFRGYLQSQLCESYHPALAITLSSLVFGAAHIGNAQGLSKEERHNYYAFSLPLISAIGGYCGYLAHKNNSLKEAVAVHTLYDLALFSIAMLAQEASIAEEKGFSISIPF